MLQIRLFEKDGWRSFLEITSNLNVLSNGIQNYHDGDLYFHDDEWFVIDSVWFKSKQQYQDKHEYIVNLEEYDTVKFDLAQRVFNLFRKVSDSNMMQSAGLYIDYGDGGHDKSVFEPIFNKVLSDIEKLQDEFDKLKDKSVKSHEYLTSYHYQTYRVILLPQNSLLSDYKDTFLIVRSDGDIMLLEMTNQTRFLSANLYSLRHLHKIRSGVDKIITESYTTRALIDAFIKGV